jgi:hypothetical protein
VAFGTQKRPLISREKQQFSASALLFLAFLHYNYLADEPLSPPSSCEIIMPAAQPKQKHKKKRIPKLKFTTSRNIGWHVSYRDPKTGTPTKHRFGNVSRGEASAQYEKWLVEYLSGHGPPPKKRKTAADPTTESAIAKVEAVPGSMLLVASSLIRFEEQRTRECVGSA